MNEYGVPHLVQKPSGRPGRPFFSRPTGVSHLEQNRLRSGTSGLASTACAGSAAGTVGTVTRPAPSRWRVPALTLPRLLRTETERPLPVRVERCERDRPDIERDEPVRVERAESGSTRADGT